jgi:hypothetical protein
MPIKFWSENMKQRDDLEDLEVYGEIIDFRETGLEDVDYIHLAQNREQWRALVNTVMNHRVP